MTADIDLVIGGIEIASRGDHFGLIVALEARGRHYIEESVGAIAVLARKTAALDLQLFHIFGIDEGRDVGRNVLSGWLQAA